MGLPPLVDQLPTREHKYRYWKTFDNRRMGYVNVTKPKFEGLLKRQAKRLGSLPKAIKSPSELPLDVVSEIQSEWEKILEAQGEMVAKAFGEIALEQLGDYTFDPTDDAIQSYIRSVSKRQAELIVNTTEQQYRNVMLQAQSENMTITQTRDLVLRTFDEQTRSRAERIARTEVIQHSNAGTQLAVDQTGQNYEHVWLATMDKRVRDTHAGMNGQRQPKGEPYELPSGARLKFPGDSSMGAPAGEVINCRCVELFELGRDDEIQT